MQIDLVEDTPARARIAAEPDPGDHPCGAGGRPRTRFVPDVLCCGEYSIAISDVKEAIVDASPDIADIEDATGLEITVSFREDGGCIVFRVEGFE